MILLEEPETLVVYTLHIYWLLLPSSRVPRAVLSVELSVNLIRFRAVPAFLPPQVFN